MEHSDLEPSSGELVTNIRARLADLRGLLEEVESESVGEDALYRFYHQSFKVYYVQDTTVRIVDCLRSLAPRGSAMSPVFEAIYQRAASGKQFSEEHNAQWASHTQPFIEGFLHAKFFLEMAVKYGQALQSPPTVLPRGWAALLCLYGIR